MSVQSVGPKTPAPRREVWNHVQWGVRECGMPVPAGVEFLNEDRPADPLIVVLKVSTSSDGEEWSGFLELRGHEQGASGALHYGEVLGWRWHVDYYGSLPAQVAQQNLPRSTEVARLPRLGEVVGGLCPTCFSEHGTARLTDIHGAQCADEWHQP